MNLFSKLAAGAILGLGALVSGQASAMSGPAVHAPDGGGLLQQVRYEQRCHREMVMQRDRSGRRVEVPRRVCRQVWVGPRR